MNEIITPLLTQQIRQLPLYITQIGVNFIQKHYSERPNGFEDYQLAICIGGKGIFICNDKKYEINEHDAFIFSPHVPHCYYPASDKPWVLDWVCFRGQCFEPLCKDGYYVLPHISSQNSVFALRSIEALLRENRLLNQLEASKALYALLTDLTAYRFNCYENGTQTTRSTFLIAFLEKNIDRDISLPEMAEYLKVSVSYLCRMFKNEYGMSPQQCMIHLRMNRAKQMILSNPSMRIKEIASQCGYSDLSYFGAEFKRHTGVSPSVFRGHIHR